LYLEDSVSRSGDESVGCPALRTQPISERVSAEVTLYDEPSPALGRQSIEPCGEKSMESGLPDANRRIRPQSVEAGRRERGKVAWISEDRGAICIHEHGVDFAGTGGSSVLGAEGDGSFVHVDGPDLGLRSPTGKCERNGSVSAANVADLTHLRSWPRGLLEQESRSGIDPISREHPTVGGEAEVAVRQGEFNLTRLRGDLWCSREVVGGWTGHDSTLPLGCGSSCHPHHR